MENMGEKNKSEVRPAKINYRLPLITIILILCCFLTFTFTWKHFWNTNEYSRIFLTRALIDHQSFSIDKIIVTHDTQDKSLFKGNYYSNKAPLSSFIAAPAYLAIRLLELFGRMNFSEPMEVYIITSLCISIPSALFLILIFKFWISVTLHYHLRRAVMIAYALGTMIWPYSTMYYGHVLAGMSIFLAFLIVFNYRDVKGGRRTFFECGFFCGLAFAIEYPVALIAFCIFMYAAAVGNNLRAAIYQVLAIVFISFIWLFSDRIEALISPHVLDLVDPHGLVLTVSIIVSLIIGLGSILKAPVNFMFFLGAALPIGATFYYHLKCFGGIFQFPYYHETYLQFAVAHQKGIAGVTFPLNLRELGSHLYAALQLLISPYRGLFFYSPFLLLGVSGMIKMMRDPEWRREGRLFLAIAVIYFLFLSSFSDWEGGWSIGPRHLVPILPFLATAVIFQVEKTKGKIKDGLIWFLAVFSLVAIILIFLGTVTFPYFPKEFKNPIYEISWQLFLRGKLAPTIGEFYGLVGYYRLIPLIIFVGVLIAILVRDLSLEISRKKSSRVIFMVTVLGIAAVLLFAGMMVSRIKSGKLSTHQQFLRDTQRQRVEKFMRRDEP